jgi:SAM-dependent methyltransferase
MKALDRNGLAAATESRFDSEYHYARFEYLRSPKVIETVQRAGLALGGRVLDSGCGSGGVAISLGEETRLAVGLDLSARFRDSGTRLAAELGVANTAFVQGDGTRLPFREASFDLVLSHSVIEHVSSATDYLRECFRVLRPGGALYLSTAPYLSLAGAHLPRLRLPIPLHILFGRRLAFRFFCWLARHAPWSLQERRGANTFIVLAESGQAKRDDLLQRVTVTRLNRWIAESGFRRAHEDRHVTGFFQRALPRWVRRHLESTPWFQDVMIGHIQHVLVKP